jgi:hypothetical protein
LLIFLADGSVGDMIRTQVDGQDATVVEYALPSWVKNFLQADNDLGWEIWRQGFHLKLFFQKDLCLKVLHVCSNISPRNLCVQISLPSQGGGDKGMEEAKSNVYSLWFGIRSRLR